MSRFFNAALCTGVFLLLFLCNQTTVHADAVTLNEMFKENGNDVVVMFDIADLSRNASDGLPKTFVVNLLAGSTVVGTFEVTLDQNNTTVTSLGGYITSSKLTHTFPSASNAVTGRGSNYSLELKPIPEPTTLLLFGSGLVGVVSSVRRRRKARLRS